MLPTERVLRLGDECRGYYSRRVSHASLRRFASALMIALAFGVTWSIVKGNGAGVRDAVGNISAPWLLLPFLAGALVAKGRRPAAGAGVGLLVTLAALAGFYVANAFVLDLGPHPLLVDVRLAVVAGKHYFALALLSGPAFGALGGWWQRHRSTSMAVLVTSLLVFEPLALIATASWFPARSYPGALAGEAAVGLLACIAVALRLGSSSRPTRLPR